MPLSKLCCRAAASINSLMLRASTMQDIPVRSFESSSSLRQFLSSQYRGAGGNTSEQAGLDTVCTSQGPAHALQICSNPALRQLLHTSIM